MVLFYMCVCVCFLHSFYLRMYIKTTLLHTLAHQWKMHLELHLQINSIILIQVKLLLRFINRVFSFSARAEPVRWPCNLMVNVLYEIDV